MLKIGLTGGIGSGKTAVSDYFASLGTPVIDTDIIARQLVKPGSDASQAILKAFGKHLIDHDGNLDRKQLAQIVFNDESQRHKLEVILHPRINHEIERQLAALKQASSDITKKNQANKYVIIVIPLLIEAGLQQSVDRILAIDADEKIRLQRVYLREQRSKEEILKIIQTQTGRQTLIDSADDVISNNGDLEQLHRQISDLHQKYSSNRPFSADTTKKWHNSATE